MTVAIMYDIVHCIHSGDPLTTQTSKQSQQASMPQLDQDLFDFFLAAVFFLFILNESGLLIFPFI